MATVEVRFEDTNPVWARVQLPDPVAGTARFDIDSSGNATFTQLDVPTSQANGAIDKTEFEALTDAVAQAKTAVAQLAFINGVTNGQ